MNYIGLFRIFYSFKDERWLIMMFNLYLIQLAIIIMTIFGGRFIILYFIKGEVLLDNLIVASVGLILLISSLIWRKFNKQ